MITSKCTWGNFMNDPLRTIKGKILCRLKEDVQRLRVLPELRSCLGAEVI